MKFIYRLFFFIFLMKGWLLSDIITTKGKIEFIVQGQKAATLSQTGLAIGTESPSDNLQTLGNTNINNIQINGAFQNDPSLVSSNTTLADKHLHLVDSSSQDVEITLPSPSLHSGKRYLIKRTQNSGNVFILSENQSLIDGQTSLYLENRAFTELVSDGSEWHVIAGTSQSLSSDNLTLHWNLDSMSTTQTEVMGTGYDLNLAANNSDNTLLTGISGNAVYVERDGQWISNTAINDTLSLGPTATFSAWVKFAITPADRGNNAVIFMTVNGSHNFRYIVQTDGDVSNTSTTVGNHPLVADQWYNFALVQDGTDQIFYINGAEVGRTASSPADITLDDIYLGRACCSNMLEGSLDDFRIYNKALSSTEVKLLYINQGR